MNNPELDREILQELEKIEEELCRDPELKEELEVEEKTASTIKSFYQLN